MELNKSANNCIRFYKHNIIIHDLENTLIDERFK